MWLFFTHHMTRYSCESKDAFLKRLNDHAVSSRSLRFFTATVQDYGINLASKSGRTFVTDRFGKGHFIIAVTASETIDGCVVYIVVKPSWGNIAMNVLILLFVLICPFPIELVAAFAGVLFLVQLVTLAFTVWWANDLLEKKLLAKACHVKDRTL